ncbi:MAG: hypothetical protein WC339_00950 [Candidatus Izemoplasmatales bacterium]|jgi:hypothetical protein
MSRLSNKAHQWFRLDNAAKIYPVIVSVKNSSIYRMGVIMKDPVDPRALQSAVLECRDRFPSFFVKLRRGFFWYYFESNDKNPVVYPESPFICQSINTYTNNGFLFTFYYYQNRISLEVFHALSDGYGSFMLLKAVLFRYLEKIGRPQQNDGSVMMIDQAPDPDEFVDCYKLNNTRDKIQKFPIHKAYRVPGKRYKHRGIHITIAHIDTVALQDLAQKHGASVTRFLVGLYHYSLQKNGDPNQLRKRPLTISVPVNLRRYFPAITVRNFSLYFNSTTQYKDDPISLAAILETLKPQFESGLNKQSLLNRLNSNMAFENNFLIRILPLFIKKPLFKIGYTLIGNSPISSSISNFGEITLPKTMADAIESFEFNLASSYKPGIALNTFNNQTTMVFSRYFQESSLEQTYLSYLGEHGVKVEVLTNSWK